TRAGSLLDDELRDVDVRDRRRGAEPGLHPGADLALRLLPAVGGAPGGRVESAGDRRLLSLLPQGGSAMAIEARPRLTLDDILVIDADVHAHEQPDQMLPYVEPAWRGALANVARVPHRYLNRPGFSPTAAVQLPGS